MGKHASKCDDARATRALPAARGRKWRAPRAAALVAMACLCLLGLCLLGGCRDTEALKEIVFDQTSSNIDYDNEQKFLVNDSTSSTESDQVPASEISDDAPANDEEQNLLVYSSTPNTEGFTTKASVYGDPAQFPGLEASQAVRPYYSESDDAIDYDVPHEDEEHQLDAQDDTTQSTPESQSDATGSGDSASAGRSGQGGGDGTGSSDEGDGDEGDSQGNDEDPDSDQDPVEGDDGSGFEGDVETKDPTQAFTEPEPADHIAAYGTAAVIVQMIGGQGALVAADRETLSGGFSTVFADEGAANIAVGWSGDGTDAATMDVDAIIASGANTILCYSSNYQDSLTNSQRYKLDKAGVTFTVIYTPTNSSYIKDSVTLVGDLLAQASDIGQAGRTRDNASAYVSWHDALVNECIGANGGKLAGDSGVVYELKNNAGYAFNDSAKRTLLIDAWDPSAKYAHAVSDTGGSSWLPVSNGAGLSSIGWANTPVNFYIQAGGLVNNACVKSAATSQGRIFAWQFNTNFLSFQKDYWTYDAGGAAAASLDIGVTQGEAWGKSLFDLTGSSNGDATSVSGGSGSMSSQYKSSGGFGSTRFPKIIVCSAEAKSGIVNNSKDKNGIYHPYDEATGTAAGMSFGQGLGKLLNSSIIYSSIGAEDGDATVNAFEDDGAIPESRIAVNPSGLLCDWLEGTPESVLEAAWVSDAVNDDASGVDSSAKTREFYSTFYRYDLTGAELSAIMSGK